MHVRAPKHTASYAGRGLVTTRPVAAGELLLVACSDLIVMYVASDALVLDFLDDLLCVRAHTGMGTDMQPPSSLAVSFR